MHHGSRKSGSKSARQRRRIIGLTARDEDRLKRQLRLTTPSEPWVEAQFKTASDKDTDGGKLTYRYRDPHVFPPGGPNTRMIRCAECGVFNPPNALEHGNTPSTTKPGAALPRPWPSRRCANSTSNWKKRRWSQRIPYHCVKRLAILR